MKLIKVDPDININNKKKKARGTEPKCQRELTLKKLALKKFANHYRFLSFQIVMKYFYLLLLLSQVK